MENAGRQADDGSDHRDVSRRIFLKGSLGSLAAMSMVAGRAGAADEARWDRRRVSLWAPYAEWSLEGPRTAGNPFDVRAKVVFQHRRSDARRVTEMFYDRENVWKFRFTGTAPGTWTFRISSPAPSLDGHRGSVRVEPQPDPAVRGFMTSVGNKWARMKAPGEPPEAFVPQIVMYTPAIKKFLDRPEDISNAIETFMHGHGFNGFHVPCVCGRWFDIDASERVTADMKNPDPRTFRALEEVITRVHAAGGVVHIWSWGDQMRRWTPIELEGGINGPIDRRLQRYTAARLGPLPGWSMGYGFDLDEWVEAHQIQGWHDYMQEHFGWFHFLGGRPAGPNRGTDHGTFRKWNENMDYASYEHHRPTPAVYAAALDANPNKPVMSEDRFRIRTGRYEHPHKDYSPEMTRRGLWHSMMAGGVANIWGNYTPPEGQYDGDGRSLPYRHPHWIKTCTTFFLQRGRFRADMQRAGELTDGLCLKSTSAPRCVFYAEDTDGLTMDLRGMDGPLPAVAVDTRRPYRELDLGELKPQKQELRLPRSSDWAVAVGDFAT